jgi:hypothetical protein
MKITPEELQEKFGDNVYAANEYVRGLMPKYPERPTKPKLEAHTSQGAAEYSKRLKVYEKEYKAFEKLKNEWDGIDGESEQTMKAYVQDVSGFNDLPQKSKHKVWQKAYDDGHSGGWSQIYSELCELIDLF